MALTLRTLKGSRLTHKELDDNFRHFTGSHTVNGTVTATAFVGDGSGLTNLPGASLTGTGILSGSIQIAELGAGIVSGSSQLDGEVFGFGADIVATGSFTGSFVGDGSGLTGISAGASAISGLSDVNLNALSDGEYLSYDAASTRWVNVAAPTADLTGTEVISGSGFVHSNPGGGVLPTWALNEYISLNKGLSVLATGNNPFVTIDTTSATTTDPVLKVLGSNSTEELVVTNTEVQINDKLTLNSQFSNGGIIPTTDGIVTARVVYDGANWSGHVSASLFSGSFVGDGSGLTGLPAADLTGTTVISGSGLEWASNPYVAWNFNEGVDLNNRFTVYPSNTVVNNEGVKFTSANIGLQNSYMKFYQFGSNTNDIEINTTRGHISASAFSGSFSGSFEGTLRNRLRFENTAYYIDPTGMVNLRSADFSHGVGFNGAIVSTDDVNHSIASGEVFKVTAGNFSSQIFRVNGDKEAVLNATLTVSDFDQNTLAFADFTGATQGVSGSFSGSFEGDGSGLTGLPAGNVPYIAGNTLPSKASSVTGSMVLVETNAFNNQHPELHIYVGAAGTGWKEVQLV